MIEQQLTADDESRLLDLAGESLRHGLQFGRAIDVVPAEFPENLQAVGATFVTLRKGPELRGCIGSMRASVHLVVDVAHNAFSAGFRDPRFPPISAEEFAELSVSISVLSPPQAVNVKTESELLELMLQTESGWILRRGEQRGLLLPSVWKTLPEPHRFLEQLKVKAGMAADSWSEDMIIERFTARSFRREIGECRSDVLEKSSHRPQVHE